MKLFQKRRVRRTTLISTGLAALLAGIYLVYQGIGLYLPILLVIPLLIFLLYKFKKVQIIMVVLLGLVAGLWRGGQMFAELKKYEPLYGSTVSILGRVSDDSGYNEERGQTEFHITDIVVEGKKLPGKIQIASQKNPKVVRGDRVIIKGKLRPSLGTSRQGSITRAEVVITERNTGFFEKARQRYFKSVAAILPEPQASLGIGYLVGLRVNIPKDLNEQLAVVGLTHIVAVSGYNVTILVRAVRRIIGKRSAYQSLISSLLLVGGFVLVAGGSPSINRAAVVCVLSLLAWYYGREFKPVLLLLLSGAITGFINPLYVWGDPGWWLSFLAFAGVLVLSPLIFRRYFSKKPPGTIKQILIETLCAQVFTLPYTMFLFGGVSLIAPLANVLVLPFIPFIMFTIFILGLVGLLFPVLAAYGAIIPHSLLNLQLWLIGRLSSFSWAHREVAISGICMFLLFAALILFTLMLHRAVQKRRQPGDQELDYVVS